MLLEVKNISKEYTSGFLGRRKVRAAENISFSVEEGDFFGLIGESGSGKSTLTKMLLGISHSDSGSIIFDGKDITNLSNKKWMPLRSQIQGVFQHPQMTFNPKRTLYDSCTEPLRIFNICPKDKYDEYVKEMVEPFGIHFDQLKKYPHEVSGGQAQRISIARALFLNPKLLICDEPTSMLDVSVQAQVLRLLINANKERNVAIVFISHDIEVVKTLCKNVAVMEKGKIVEQGSVKDVLENPKHEYTKKLISSAIEI